MKRTLDTFNATAQAIAWVVLWVALVRTAKGGTPLPGVDY
jgi:hypothetical protein